MGTPGYIPTFDRLVADDLGNSSVVDDFVADFLKKKFNDSIAPLLIVTRTEALDVPFLGKVTRSAIEQMFEEHGLRFRYDTETHAERAIQVWGSIHATPIQSLLVSYPSRRRNRTIEYRSSYILRVLSEFDRTITLDTFLHRNIGTQLRANLLFSNQRIHPDEFARGVEDIRTRIAYWEEASK
ncbi:MAG: hypothetical protein V4611_04010 [Patescibacteria group bacterium]